MATNRSALLDYANGWLVTSNGINQGVSNTDGRLVFSGGDRYLFRLYITRDEARTNYLVNTPLANNSSIDLRYTGYILQYYKVSNEYEFGDTLGSLINISVPLSEDMIRSGIRGEVIFTDSAPRDDVPKYPSFIERSTGKYNSYGIDRLVTQELMGVPIVLTVGENVSSKMLNL